jgi:mono/diheme cytochrome c family protein
MGWERVGVRVFCFALLAIGCRQDMHDQPKIEPLEANAFFADGMGARPLPAGTVARGQLRDDVHLWQGKDAAGELVDSLPDGVELSRELLEHGRTRYEIFCSVCHDSTGSGRGMIVRRGFKQPPPLYQERLLAMPMGYFYDVVTNGYGLMSSYSKQLSVSERWAVVAYLRALQLSQTADLGELPGPWQEEFHAAAEAVAAEHGDESRQEGHHE